MKAMAPPPNNCPSMATVDFSTQKDVSENAGLRSTMKKFQQTTQPMT